MSNLLIIILAIVVIVALLFVIQFLKLNRVAQKNSTEAKKNDNLEFQVELSFDDAQIYAKYPIGETVTVKWVDITMIGMRTQTSTADSAALYWGLHTGKSTPTISYPQDAIGDKALLAEFTRKLPGFDMQKVMAAATSNTSLVTPVWVKK